MALSVNIEVSAVSAVTRVMRAVREVFERAEKCPASMPKLAASSSGFPLSVGGPDIGDPDAINFFNRVSDFNFVGLKMHDKGIGM